MRRDEFSIVYKFAQRQVNDVLDKIKAEIKALTDGAETERIWNVDVLAIIDRYKAESEDER